MDTIKNKKRTAAFLAMLFVLSSCSRFLDDDHLIYFDVVGEGYVYNEYTKEPVDYASVCVGSIFENRDLGNFQIEREYFKTNKEGYFCVRFLKRYQKSNVESYTVCANALLNKPLAAPCISLSVNQLKTNSNILQLDTLWIR